MDGWITSSLASHKYGHESSSAIELLGSTRDREDRPETSSPADSIDGAEICYVRMCNSNINGNQSIWKNKKYISHTHTRQLGERRKNNKLFQYLDGGACHVTSATQTNNIFVLFFASPFWLLLYYCIFILLRRCAKKKKRFWKMDPVSRA